jgi:hypothetical protein
MAVGTSVIKDVQRSAMFDVWLFDGLSFDSLLFDGSSFDGLTLYRKTAKDDVI